jgi:hypothetical protein
VINIEKGLPKIFENKINKRINNNEVISKSYENSENNNSTPIKKKNIKDNKTIEKKIKDILNSKEYIYRIPVIIKTKEEEYKTKIIGKNNKNIITIDNQLIKIEDILDIKKEEQKSE